MPEMTSINTVYLVLGFLVPGMIATFVRAQFITGRMASHANAALSYLALSIIYYALAFQLVEYVLSIREPGYWKAMAWFFLVFVGPALLGLVLGLWAQKQVGRWILGRLHLNTVHFMPTAWDWRFAGLVDCWVLVVLKNDTKFGGYFSTGSFASSDPKERDLYIQKIYDIDEKNVWHPRDKGVLIGADEIRSIEFWPIKEETTHEQEIPVSNNASSRRANARRLSAPASSHSGSGAKANRRIPAANGRSRAGKSAKRR